MNPSQARTLFPITESRVYLFSGGVAPAASPVRAALDRWAEMWTSDPWTIYAAYEAEWELARQRFAAVIGAEPCEIALTDNTSRGSNLAVQMIDAQPGSNVVIDEWTYPSSLYPWQLPPKSHVEIRQVAARDSKILLEDLTAAIDERTVAVCVNHVSNLCGFRHNLGALGEVTRERGAYLIVDAGQSAGAVEIDVRQMKIDFLSCGALKWLLGTPGIGFFFVDRSLVDRLPPPHAGYIGVDLPPFADAEAPLTFASGARRHELGLPSLPGLEASRRGMDILLSIGMDDVQHHVVDLSGYCIEGLLQRGLRVFTPAEPEHRAGVIALPVARGDALVQFLRDRSIDIYAGLRARIDPHVFNNREDIDRLLEGMDDFAELHGWHAVQSEDQREQPNT